MRFPHMFPKILVQRKLNGSKGVRRMFCSYCLYSHWNITYSNFLTVPWQRWNCPGLLGIRGLYEMARLLLHLYGNQNGNRWGSSRSWNHAPVPYCKYGEPGDPPVGCFDLRTAFWHRICLACRTSRLACKLFNILCGPSKIMAKEVQSRCKQSLKQQCVHK